MGDLIVNNLLIISMALAILGLVVAGFLMIWINGKSSGNDRMKEIAQMIEIGAKAYLWNGFSHSSPNYSWWYLCYWCHFWNLVRQYG